MAQPPRRFFPVNGITVDVINRQVLIHGRAQIWGAEANAARAAEIQQTLNSTWTHRFDDGVRILCDMQISYRGPGSSADNVLQIEVANLTGPSNVDREWVVGQRVMQLDARRSNAFTWVVAHEFGHILGLGDRYSESILSVLRGKTGGRRTTVPHQGYDGNIMAVDSGEFTVQNVLDAMSETEASPYWINDDDQVRAWIHSHTAIEIRRLSTTNKQAAIRTLVSGWISDDDIAGIEALLAGVASATEAATLRATINLMDFTSIGQRTRMRLALDKLPR